jgi:hypothetical protein
MQQPVRDLDTLLVPSGMQKPVPSGARLVNVVHSGRLTVRLRDARNQAKGAVRPRPPPLPPLFTGSGLNPAAVIVTTVPIDRQRKGGVGPTPSAAAASSMAAS